MLWSALTGGIVAVATFLVLDLILPGKVTIGPVERGDIVLMIDGAVATPGTVRIAGGSRLDAAVRAAGGFTEDADITNLNLAGRVGDGEHITIPSIVSETTEPGTVGTPVVSSDSGLININTASVVELDQLPNVGQVIAQRIVDFREINQGFESIDQLVEIEGISPDMVEELRTLVTIND